MRRRQFLEQCGLLAGMGLSTPVWMRALAAAPVASFDSVLAADVVIIGGGTGGCAAALAAARAGRSVTMTEPTDWIGGQLTSQAVPPDESPWIEAFGSTACYRRFRRLVREFYRRNYPLTAAARRREHLDPGDGSVSALCHEPGVAYAVLLEMLAPYVSSGRVRLLLEHDVVAADVDGDVVRAATVRDLRTGDERTLTGDYFLDATEHGDLLPLSGTEYATGFESQADTDEPHAPTEAQPDNIQACTWCFAVEHVDGEDFTTNPPAEYEFWRNYVPDLTPSWPGKQLSLTYTHPITLKPRHVGFDPTGAATRQKPNLWLYRRIIARKNFREGTYRGDTSLINWPQNDYWLGNLYEVSAEEAEQHRARARQLSLSLLHWLRTEAPRDDGGEGWPGLRLRGDLTGGPDGLARAPYVRESRRILAETTVTENHVGTEARMETTGKPREEVRAATFDDSVGIGSYRIDLHPSTGGDNYLDISSLPFQIPLGALVPRRMDNLLPACKNLGVTHITNGCYRLHPVEWNIGEAAGALAAHCIGLKECPRAVRADEKKLGAFQSRLRQDGFELTWPKLRPR